MLLLFDPGGDSLLITQIEKISQGLAIKVALTQQIEGAKGDFTDLSSISDRECARDRCPDQPAHQHRQGQASAIHVDEVNPCQLRGETEIGLVAAATPQFAVLFIFLFVMFMTDWSRGGAKPRGVPAPAVHPGRAARPDPGQAALWGGGLLCADDRPVRAGYSVGRMRGLPVSMNIPGFILVTLALAATSTSLGLLFSATRLPISLAIAPMLLGGALGGCILAIDFMPSWMVPISYFMPQRYGMLGYQDLMARGGGVYWPSCRRPGCCFCSAWSSSASLFGALTWWNKRGGGCDA